MGCGRRVRDAFLKQSSVVVLFFFLSFSCLFLGRILKEGEQLTLYQGFLNFMYDYYPPLYHIFCAPHYQ